MEGFCESVGEINNQETRPLLLSVNFKLLIRYLTAQEAQRSEKKDPSQLYRDLTPS